MQLSGRKGAGKGKGFYHIMETFTPYSAYDLVALSPSPPAAFHELKREVAQLFGSTLVVRGRARYEHVKNWKKLTIAGPDREQVAFAKGHSTFGVGGCRSWYGFFADPVVRFGTESCFA